MPGLVAVKTPTQTPSLGDLFTGRHDQIQNEHSHGGEHRTPSSFPKRTPLQSPSIARAVKKTPEKLIIDESSLDNWDLGPFLLKLARDTIASGENPNKALDYAIRASKSFEQCPGSGLELAMSLHVVGAIYGGLGRFGEAIHILERSIECTDSGSGPDHALAKFAGYMQLGDTYSMIGQLDRSISCYESGLKIQMEAVGKSDPRVAGTCR